MEKRHALDRGQFFDASFAAICADPIAVVNAIYRHFGLAEPASAVVRDLLAEE